MGQPTQPPPPYPHQEMGTYPNPTAPHPAGFIQQPVVTGQPGMMPMNTMVITTTTTLQPQLGHNPSRLTCPYCQADVMTEVTYESGPLTHVIAAVMCIVGCWPCCLIPYCVDGCKDVAHQCPNCKRQLGISKRL